VLGITAFALFSVLGLVFLQGCETLGTVAAEAAVATGTLDRDEADAVKESAKAVGKSFEDITPEQEYYIGRSVGAVLLDQYRIYDDAAANRYLNYLGQSLARVSDRPELFGDYRFQILDSSEINAFATPSGLVFITRGMLRLADTEAEVAAILAHEIGHIEHRHGLKAIRTSRINTALTSVALTSAKVASDDEVEQLTETFEGSINDITSTLVNSGYSRGAEREADKSAVEILRRVGYDPWALVRVLEEMDKRIDPDGPGFAKTHPDPEDRIDTIEPMVDGVQPRPETTAVRRERYEAALSGV
jgi:predicted Zn-dependent protease